MATDAARLLSLLAFVLALAAAPARAQDPDDGFSVAVGGGPVAAVLELRDGAILVAGGFQQVQGQPCPWLCRLRHDGSRDPDFVPSGISGPVAQLAEQPDGRIVIAGRFAATGGVPDTAVARLQANGKPDPGFVAPMLQGVVHAIALQPNGRVLVAGELASADGSPRGNVLRLQANGRLDGSFADPGVDGPVHALLLQPDGRVLLGGAFDTVQGLPRSRLARLQADGTPDQDFGSPSLQVQGRILALQRMPDGRVVAAGDFSNILPFGREPQAKGAVQYRNVARFHRDGRLETGFYASLPESGEIRALQLLPDGRVLAGGSYSFAPGIDTGQLYRLDLNGRLDASYSPFVLPVHALALQRDGRVLAGGAPPTLVAGGWLQRLHPDGSVDLSLPDLGADNQVSVMAQQPDGKLLVGGWFEQIGGEPRKRLVRLLPDGSVDPDFAADADHNVYGIAVLPGGRLLVAGGFQTIAGAPRKRVALLNAQGQPFPFFAPELDAAVFGVASDRQGRFLLGGVFQTVDGLPRRRMVRLLADGSVDPAFQDPGFNQQVTDFAVLPDGKILVAGLFVTVDGVPRNGLARLHPDGSLDTSFDARLSYSAYSVLLQPDGRILVAGAFTSVDGVRRTNVARLHPDGSLDASFTPPSIFAGRVSALALQADGRVLIGGEFFDLESQPYRHVARLHADGSLDPSFRPVDVDDEVRAILLQDDGKLVIAGIFGSVDGLSRARLARLSATDAAVSVLEADADADTIVWRRGGTAPELADRPELGWVVGNDGSVLGPMQRMDGGWRFDGIPTTPTLGNRVSRLVLSAPLAGTDGLGMVSATRAFHNERLFRDGFEAE